MGKSEEVLLRATAPARWLLGICGLVTKQTHVCVLWVSRKTEGCFLRCRVGLCCSIAQSFRPALYSVSTSQESLSIDAGCVKVCGPEDMPSRGGAVYFVWFYTIFVYLVI